MAVIAFAGAEAVHGNGFIAAFVAGLAFGTVARDHCRGLYEFAEAEGQLLTLLTFAIFGGAILGPVLDELSWEIALYAVLSLTAVRVVPVALSLLGSGVHGVTYGFLGWFGPRGWRRSCSPCSWWRKPASSRPTRSCSWRPGPSR